LRLLLAQNFEFKKAFLNTKLRMRVAGEDVEASAMQWHLDRHLKDGSVVLFVPVVEGPSLPLLRHGLRLPSAWRR
jgi:predicted phage tail protein